jgi:hypothetical protein
VLLCVACATSYGNTHGNTHGNDAVRRLLRRPWAQRRVVDAVGDQSGGNELFSDPPVPVPPTDHCTLPLFSTNFTSYDAIPFPYSIPGDCAGGQWAKVVFNLSCGVTAGRQYDRTVQVFINGFHIFTGTTPEPGASLAPTWSVQADVTYLSAALLMSNGKTGSVALGTVVTDTYNGVPYCSGELQYYQSSAQYPAPPTTLAPTRAIALGQQSLGPSNPSLSSSLSLPSNIVSFAVDVMTQGQSSDEFWWSCAPSSVSTELNTCSGTAFRAMEISLDGTTVGIYPIYPYLFTGGVDPLLWRPIPGVQTLHLQPMQIELGPFVAMLNLPGPHMLNITIRGGPEGINSFWNVAANALYNVDEGSTTVTGHVNINFHTIQGNGLYPKVDVQQNGSDTYLSVSYEAAWEVEGMLYTSEGRLPLHTAGHYTFVNTQNIVSSALVYLSNITQLATLALHTPSSALSLYYPFATSIDLRPTKTGLFSQTTEMMLGFTRSTKYPFTPYTSFINNTVLSQDTLLLDGDTGAVRGTKEAMSSQNYTFVDSAGSDWTRKVKSLDNQKASEVTWDDHLLWWCDPYLGTRWPPAPSTAH